MTDSNPPTLFNSATCVRKGLCPVTDIRNKDNPLESHSLYFEQHGTGPEKILFIIGLNSSSFSWDAQVDYFGQQGDKYSILVFDNRGSGNSGAPRGPYTTSGMAEDAIALLDYVGWTKPRDLHVVSGSLGGMIAQELALRIPERIVSLLLAVTTPGGYPWTNFPPWKGIVHLTKVTLMTDMNAKIPILMDMVYHKSWLEAVNESDPKRRKNKDIEREHYLRRFAVTKPPTLIGSLSQMCAGLTHHVRPTQLAQISSSIPKVVILTGDDDCLIHPSNSVILKRHMPEAELVQWENTGHAVHWQRRNELHALIDRMVEEGRNKLEGKTS